MTLSVLLELIVFILLHVYVHCATSMKRVAIIGGGYAGLANSYKFSKVADILHVYDYAPVGYAEASSASAGIMHPMTTRGNVIWKGLEGLESSLAMMGNVKCKKYANICDTSVELQRVIYSPKDFIGWQQTALIHPDLVDIKESSTEDTAVVGKAHIKRAAVVNSHVYLKALWEATRKNCAGAEWKNERVSNLHCLSEQYDAVIVACGAGVIQLQQCSTEHSTASTVGLERLSKIRLVRGQNLLYKRPRIPPEHDNSANVAYLSGEYVIPCDAHGHAWTYFDPTLIATQLEKGKQYAEKEHMQESDSKNYLMCGSTHEHITPEEYESSNGTSEQSTCTVTSAKAAVGLLGSKITRLYPPLAESFANNDMQPLAGMAGTRVVTQRSELGRLPVVGRLPGYNKRNVWVVTGFGARGLIFHALTAEYLYNAILSNDDNCIPHGLGV